MKNIFQYSIILLMAFACAEEKRFDINVDDHTPPGQPTIKSYKALNGGARLFYAPPADEDVLSIDVEYVNNDKVVRYSSSYLTDSIDIYGLPDTVDYKLKICAVDRAGNASSAIEYSVRPLESALSKVSKSLVAKGGFDAIFLTWTNELKRPVNVIMEYSFTLNGAQRSLTTVFSSNEAENRQYITDLALDPTSPIAVQAKVSDEFGNVSKSIDFGKIYVLKDVEIPKFDADKKPLWSMPEGETYPSFGGGVAQCFGNNMDGKLSRVIDGVIDEYENLNYMMTSSDRNWNVLIDLGDYYELSRIVTHQRQTASGGLEESVKRGSYYQASNVGQYAMYRWDEEKSEWELISNHRIPMPTGNLSELEWNRLGRAGDMAYMYPEDPGYTKPTRWFRYEGKSGFNDNYSSGCQSLSEISLYGKKK